MAPLTKERGLPEKEFFVFKKPMAAKGREENLLGVAFEDPRVGTLGSFTPQGPQESKETQPASEVQPPNDDNGTAGPPAEELDAQAGTSGDDVVPTQSPPQAPMATPAEPVVINYRTPCRWPKFLVNKIYPAEATDAVGVEQILENVAGAHAKTTILDAIASTLKVRRAALDEAIIPVLRRWSMEDPKGKINDLLHADEYRHRVIDLFEQQTTPTKPKILYVATNLIACGGLSFNRVKELHMEFEGKGGDPTGTINVKLGAGMFKIKHSTLKRTYTSDVVMCMSYRRVRYERVKADAPGLWQKWFGKPKLPDDKRAIKFSRDDGAHDFFFIDKYDTEGQVAAWMSPARRHTENLLGDLNPSGMISGSSELNAKQHVGRKEDAKGTGIFEEASFYEGHDTNEFDNDDFPAGFFGENLDVAQV